MASYPDFGALSKGQECLEHMVAQNRKRLEIDPSQRPRWSGRVRSAISDLESRLKQWRADTSAGRTETEGGISDFEERLRTTAEEQTQSQSAEMAILAERLEAFDARLKEIERRRAEAVSVDAVPAGAPSAPLDDDDGSSRTLTSVEELEERLQTAFTTVWASFAEIKTETKKISPLQDLILRLRVDLDRFDGQQ